jgi:hypothetical protein
MRSALPKTGRSVNGWYVGNVIFGGLVGFLIVDPLTGAMWVLEPKDVKESLPLKAAGRAPEEGLTVVLRETLLDQQSLLQKATPIAMVPSPIRR